jgi:hypothetical protein
MTTVRLALAALTVSGCMRRDVPKGEPVGVSTVTGVAANLEPLPSWKTGPTKQAILDAVAEMTRQGASPEEDRIAVFEVDGTLWPERPTAEALFTVARLKGKIAWTPGLAAQEPFRSILAEDVQSLVSMGPEVVSSAIAETHAGMTDDAFELAARSFITDTRHPVLGAPYPKLAYRPMRELLTYLRARKFTVYLSTTEDQSFARAYSLATFDVPRENVIGSTFGKTVIAEDGGVALEREPEIISFNDREEKVANIERHTGRRPMVAGGRVGTTGDIATLTYTRESPRPSLAIAIFHDDPERELSYREPGDPTLLAARKHGYVVVSMQNDWATVFDQPLPPRTTR